MTHFIYYPKHRHGQGWQREPVKIYRGKDGKLHSAPLKGYRRIDRRVSREIDRHRG